MSDETTPEEAPPARPGDKLVLLVDDDESLLDLMQHVVQKEGFRTERAVDGAEALRKVEALSPDLIVLDLMLPGVAGYEVIRRLQELGMGSVPVVVVTGRAMDRKTIDAMRREPNVREFMEKPVRPLVLGGHLHRLLGTRREGA